MSMTVTTAPRMATLETARAIFGMHNVVCHNAVQEATGLVIEFDEVPIHFTEEELVRAANSEQVLVLTPTNRTLAEIEEMFTNQHLERDGLSFIRHTRWARDHSLPVTDAVPFEWRLAGVNFLENTKGVNYLQQIRPTIEHVRTNVFAGGELPAHIQEAVSAFESQEADLRRLINFDHEKACRRLMQLSINNLIRESESVAFWLTKMIRQFAAPSSLSGHATWTNTLHSADTILSVGCLHETEVDVDYFGPHRALEQLGLRFSWAATLRSAIRE